MHSPRVDLIQVPIRRVQPRGQLVKTKCGLVRQCETPESIRNWKTQCLLACPFSANPTRCLQKRLERALRNIHCRAGPGEKQQPCRRGKKLYQLSFPEAPVQSNSLPLWGEGQWALLILRNWQTVMTCKNQIGVKTLLMEKRNDYRFNLWLQFGERQDRQEATSLVLE